MQLQKGPLGLLGAFALKTIGRNPTQFGDTVQPVADVYDQYLAQSELGIATTNAAIGLNNFQQLTIAVPAGKMWRLFGVSWQATLNAADIAIAMQGEVLLLRLPSGAQLGQPSQPSTIGVERRLMFFTQPPFVVPSGYSIRVSMTFSAALTNSVTGTMFVIRQEIDV